MGRRRCCCEGCWEFEDLFNRDPGSTPWKGPDDTGTGIDGDAEWTDHANVATNDENYATNTVGSGNSEYLKLQNFNFNVPTGVTITDVAVRVYRRASDVNTIYDSSVRLLYGGTADPRLGANLAAAGTWANVKEGVEYTGTVLEWDAVRSEDHTSELQS